MPDRHPQQDILFMEELGRNGYRIEFEFKRSPSAEDQWMSRRFLCRPTRQKIEQCVEKMLALPTQVVVGIVDLKKLSDAARDRFIAIVKLLRACSDLPNVMRIFEMFACEKRVYVVEEFAGGGCYHDEMTPINRCQGNEARARDVFVKIANGLAHLHANNIVHNNLTFKEVFLTTKGDIKVGGFQHYYQVDCGQFFSYGKSNDVLRLGVLLRQLLVGLSTEDHNSDIPKSFSGACRDLLMKILTRENDKRITIEQVLVHPWMRSQQQSENESVFSVDSLDRLCAPSIKYEDYMLTSVRKITSEFSPSKPDEQVKDLSELISKIWKSSTNFRHHRLRHHQREPHVAALRGGDCCGEDAVTMEAGRRGKADENGVGLKPPSNESACFGDKISRSNDKTKTDQHQVSPVSSVHLAAASPCSSTSGKVASSAGKGEMRGGRCEPLESMSQETFVVDGKDEREEKVSSAKDDVEKSLSVCRHRIEDLDADDDAANGDLIDQAEDDVIYDDSDVYQSEKVFDTREQRASGSKLSFPASVRTGSSDRTLLLLAVAKPRHVTGDLMTSQSSHSSEEEVVEQRSDSRSTRNRPSPPPPPEVTSVCSLSDAERAIAVMKERIRARREAIVDRNKNAVGGDKSVVIGHRAAAYEIASSSSKPVTSLERRPERRDLTKSQINSRRMHSHSRTRHSSRHRHHGQSGHSRRKKPKKKKSFLSKLFSCLSA